MLSRPIFVLLFVSKEHLGELEGLERDSLGFLLFQRRLEMGTELVEREFSPNYRRRHLRRLRDRYYLGRQRCLLLGLFVQ